MLSAILEIIPALYGFWMCMIEARERCNELSHLVNELQFKVDDMSQKAIEEEQIVGKKRKNVVDAFFKQVEEYKAAAQETLNQFRHEQGRWGIQNLRLVMLIVRYISEGNELSEKGSRLLEEGLTLDEFRTRGHRLAVGKLVTETAQMHLKYALQVIESGTSNCIGIYGPAGAGKTNLMKHIYNGVFENKDGFKAVYWASAPAPTMPGNKAIQDRVAQGMWFGFEDDDEVRRASLMAARLRELAPGRVVLFLDNVPEAFPSYEVLGIPGTLESLDEDGESTSKLETILVFTCQTRDVCNRMKCGLTLKMDLLPETEAQELFMHEAGRSANASQVLCNQDLRVQEVAVRVANQCARMPLAIILIARSLVGTEDIHEWRTRLNELMDRIETINDEEFKILEQLNFGYGCIKDETTKSCFLAAAKSLANDLQVTKEDIVQEWMSLGIIGKDRPVDNAIDQGHTIINQLERMCLLEVAEPNESVTMNKWIRKMAARCIRATN